MKACTSIFTHTFFIRCIIVLVVCSFCVFGAKKNNVVQLYPGITPQQDTLAMEVLQRIYMFEWEAANETCAKMQELEIAENLPPLSHLFAVAGRVLMILNDEYPDIRLRPALIREAEKIATQGIYRTRMLPDDPQIRATHLFIRGGIKGFISTLKMKSNPLSALSDGLEGLAILDTALALNPKLYDANLGRGLFDCAVAKAPKIVISAIGVMGKRTVSLQSGLANLRISASKGRYTQTASRQYLIQFLTPYDVEEKTEKELVFKQLQNDYPKNPYFLFQAIDETLCFFHESLLSVPSNAWLKERLGKFTTKNYSTRRYAALIRQQYNLIRTGYDPEITGDDAMYLRSDFSFYKYLCQGVRLKYEMSTNPVLTNDLLHANIKEINELRQKATKELDASRMNDVRKDYYRWHIRDGLRISRVY